MACYRIFRHGNIFPANRIDGRDNARLFQTGLLYSRAAGIETRSEFPSCEQAAREPLPEGQLVADADIAAQTVPTGGVLTFSVPLKVIGIAFNTFTNTFTVMADGCYSIRLTAASRGDMPDFALTVNGAVTGAFKNHFGGISFDGFLKSSDRLRFVNISGCEIVAAGDTVCCGRLTIHKSNI